MSVLYFPELFHKMGIARNEDNGIGRKRMEHFSDIQTPLRYPNNLFLRDEKSIRSRYVFATLVWELDAFYVFFNTRFGRERGRTPDMWTEQRQMHAKLKSIRALVLISFVTGNQLRSHQSC